MSLLADLSREQRREAIKALMRENKHWPESLIHVPPDRWQPVAWDESKRIAVYRSRAFLVQVFEEDNGIVRLSVNRTTYDKTRDRWDDHISWDELQALKNQSGYAEREAVEVYPAIGHEVNVANMRHLWILPEPMPFSWRKRGSPR